MAASTVSTALKGLVLFNLFRFLFSLLKVVSWHSFVNQYQAEKQGTLCVPQCSRDSPGNSTCFGLPGLSTLSPALRGYIPFCLDSHPTSFP